MFRTLRPSPALVVASLALFVAIGGTAYAASTINGSSITDHSIAGRKLMNDTLGGAQINEPFVGTVPNDGDIFNHTAKCLVSGFVTSTTASP